MNFASYMKMSKMDLEVYRVYLDTELRRVDEFLNKRFPQAAVLTLTAIRDRILDAPMGKLNAIKALREAAPGMGLKEAKDIVDFLPDQPYRFRFSDSLSEIEARRVMSNLTSIFEYEKAQ